MSWVLVLAAHDLCRSAVALGRQDSAMAKPGPHQLEMNMYAEQIRPIVAEHARLRTPVDQLSDDSDLYEAGLTSLSTVNLMLALEEHFDVEFSDKMLGRKTFASIGSLSNAIAQLLGPAKTPAIAPTAPELRA